MDRPSNEFFSRAAFTLKQYRAFRVGDAGDRFVDRHDSGTAAHEIVEAVPMSELLFEGLVLPREIFVFQGTANDQTDVIDNERLAEIVEGAGAEPIHGRLER